MDQNSDSLTEPLLPTSPVPATPEPASEADESDEMPPTVSTKSSKRARIFRIAATFLVFVFIVVYVRVSVAWGLLLGLPIPSAYSSFANRVSNYSQWPHAIPPNAPHPRLG